MHPGKQKSNQKEINDAFLSMIEKIANGKVNVLDFGSPEMTFFRGEIHIIKIIGDQPGIFSSEIARQMGITRAVIHKTLLKLKKRELIKSQFCPTDKKKKQLFLTAKGEVAYLRHESYHNQIDRPFFEFLGQLDQDQANLLKTFLDLANNLIDKHF